jgi:hypothetical protein
MADIKITNIPGSDLLVDSESFLQELTNDEIINTHGGFSSVSIKCPDNKASLASIWC